MTEASDASQDIYDAVQEIGATMTLTTIARVNQADGHVAETTTDYSVKVSPPQRMQSYENGTLIERDQFRITVPALNLALTPARGMNCTVGSTSYRVVGVDEARLQDTVLAYELRCELLGT